MTTARKPRNDEVDVTPLREAFQRSGITGSELAERLGWLSTNGRPDETRVMRKLGLRQYTAHRRKWVAEHISRENAAKLCRALHIDPVDVGL